MTKSRLSSLSAVGAMIVCAGSLWAQSSAPAPRSTASDRAAQPRTGERQNADRQQGDRPQRMRDGGGPGGPGGGMGGGMRALFERQTVTRRELEQISKDVQLTKEQEQAALTLWDGFDEQVNTERDAVRAAREEAMQNAAAGDGMSAFDSMQELQKKSRAKIASMETQVLSDVQALLEPAQKDKWDGAIKNLRRGQAVRKGLLSGERMDVGSIVADMKLSESELSALQPVLEQYRTDLDRELTERDAILGEDFSPMAFRDETKREELLKKLDTRREASEKVRDINKRFARQVHDLLPAERQAAFDTAVKQASFPDVYRRSEAGRALDEVMGWSDLSDQQLERVVAIREQFDRDSGALAPKLEQATLDVEKNFNVRDMLGRGGQRFGGGQGGGGGGGQQGGQQGGQNDEMRALRVQRRDIDDKTLKALKDVLTPEQQEKLPKPRDGGGRGRGGRDEGV